ncbi:LapA family protein [Pseudarthrobacter sp. NPDC089323]
MSAGQYTPGTGGQPEPGPDKNYQAERAGGTAAPNQGRAGAPTGPAPTSPVTSGPAASQPAAAEPRVTRAGVVWAAVVAALVLLILLIVFILQNQDLVLVRFLGFEGAVPLGMALFIASVTGGVLVAVAGGARILQLRANARRARTGQRR